MGSILLFVHFMIMGPSTIFLEIILSIELLFMPHFSREWPKHRAFVPTAQSVLFKKAVLPLVRSGMKGYQDGL